MFRRQRAASADEPQDVTGGPAAQNGASTEAAARGRTATTAGKGRPTPKRSEAAPRRQPFTAPGNRKERAQHARAERARRAEGLRRCDPKYLPARDAGPVRTLARDYVDSRRMFSNYYFYVFGVMFVLLLLERALPAVAFILPPLILATLAVFVLEGFITSRRLRELAGERFPGEPTRGVAVYAMFRAAQIRKLRMPPPRVKRGDKI